MPSPALPFAVLKIGLIHATLVAVQPMVTAFRERAPAVTLLHFLDEGLLPLVNREGLTPHAIGELERLVERAVASDVAGILLTCSAYSPVVPAIQARCPVPILSADDAMLRAALALGSRLGVIATVEAAGPTTAALLKELAAETGQPLTLDVRVVPAAFAALKAGDGPGHDRLVREQITALLPLCDAVILAQISMARALTGAPVFAKPVLTSPETSIAALLARLPSPVA